MSKTIDDLLDEIPEVCYIHIGYFMNPYETYQISLTRTDGRCYATYKNDRGGSIFFGSGKVMAEAIEELKKSLDQYGVRRNRYEFVYDPKSKEISFMESGYRPIVPNGEFDANDINF